MLSPNFRASQMALLVKNLPANAGDLMICGFNAWVRQIPWRRAWQPTPVFFRGASVDTGAWQAYIVHGLPESRTQLSD